MKVKVFCIYDSKAEAYGQPFFSQSTGSAIRAFSDDANSDKKDSGVAMHPEDFTLFEIGEYDHNTGMMLPLEVKVSRGCAIDLVRETLRAV